MDPSLLRERELFKKRALSTPVVEKRLVSSESSTSSSKKKKAKLEHGGSSGSKQNSEHSNGSFNLKALSGSSGYKFGVLAKIVNYMKFLVSVSKGFTKTYQVSNCITSPSSPTRHQRGDTHPLTLEEILDETQHLDIGLKQKQWLMTEALVNNPKIEVIDGKYAFKPKYNLKDKKALLRLLDKHDQRGLGGILLEDIEEGLPNSQKAVKALGDQILFVSRPDKKKILFFNDKSCQFSVDEEFQKLWRSVTVDSMDEEKIEEYLKRQGISSMQESGPKKVAPIQRRKKPASQKKRRFKTHNEHMAGVLKDYSDIAPGK
ncbi:transcription initiation factor IIE subunit beta isoform X1 [Phyllostomus discolor]|uniref:Transcription initiation factor IIE subunit beta n=1 Tax=Phyllostomus discolor TaxID=89673 RepID=A0A7E6CKY3_9CHIR|nr:transcription initiation factor IIE subunit beta isoform X1 [Phyllostomus discolor]XP_035867542.1 transcription initiation factor IIE subunit beta isoform X1 [Phyllostomus discolor]XP_035867543.1 transcription initiation factor IIE subunit beta isoform X1 [Phyllostomus discolor]